MKEVWKKVIFWALMFFGALLILSQIGYSDGDDAFFYQYSHEMGFFEYLGWRYETWVGRLSGEAMVYLTFRMGPWFWRVVNALMLVLLPLGVLTLAAKAAGVHGERVGLSYHAASVTGYLLMAAMTIGYAAVWMNGSIFYTWSFTCGVWALVPVADVVFETGEFSWKRLCYSIPCAILASMSIEQMGAVLFAFEALAVFSIAWRKRRVCVQLVLQTAVTLAAFIVLFLAPGNEIRVAAEIANWMPQYASLSLGEHLFLTVQWLLSSFANENRLFLCGIWLAGILHIRQQSAGKKSDAAWTVSAAVFFVSALLPFFGIRTLGDLGMNITDITVRIEEVPQASAMTGVQWFALFWWAAALLFTFFFLVRVSKGNWVLLFAYLGSIASEAIMYFSPTMYASGARVYYLTDWMCLFIMICLGLTVSERKWRNAYVAALGVLGVWNFVYQLPVFLEVLR